MTDDFSAMTNTREYWNRRFEGDWQAAQGAEQTRFFADLAIAMLPPWFRKILVNEGLTLCDWGCALGQGVDSWAKLIGCDRVAGYDFAVGAIEEAQRAFPDLTFFAEPFENGSLRFDILFSSNVLEHLTDPFETLRSLSHQINRYLVLLLPFQEKHLISEHVQSFTFETLPFRFGRWTLVHFADRDVAKLPVTYWRGRQALLIYEKSAAADWPTTPMSDLSPCLAELTSLREKTSASADLTGMIESNTRLLVSLEQERTRLAQMLETQQTSLKQLQEHSNSLQRQFALEQQDKQRLHKELSSRLDQERIGFVQTLGAREKTLEGLRKQSDLLRQRLALAQADQLRLQNEALAAREQSRSQHAELAARLEELEAHCARSQQEGRSLEAQLLDRDRSLADSKQRAESLQKQYETQLASLRAEQAQLKATIAALQKDRSELLDIKASRSYRLTGRFNDLRYRLFQHKPRRPAAAEEEPRKPASSLAASRLPTLAGGKRTVGAILDEFTRACLSPEFRLIRFGTGDWTHVLEANPADFVLIESAWHGNQDAWQYRIATYPTKVGTELEDLVSWARAKGLPVVFWNKEDPAHFNDFIETASKCDYVFTTDLNCLPLYKSRCGHDRVFPLPFAAQPHLHNPILQKARDGRVCFAGTYHADKFDQRARQMDVVLRPALDFGLDIYDRMHGYGGPDAHRYRWPDVYQKAIRGGLPYGKIIQAYKSYRVFLNTNSVVDSPTMFSRRVFELLASGTPVISAYSKGIENLLGGDVVALVHEEEEVREELEKLLEDDQYWGRKSVRGIRKVLQEHVYAQRMQFLCESIGLETAKAAEPQIWVLANVESADQLERVGRNLARQRYRSLRPVVICQRELRNYDLLQVESKLGHRRVQVIAPRELGRLLDEIPRSDLIAVLSGETGEYGPEYLGDAELAIRHFDDVEIVGKLAHFRVGSAGSISCVDADHEHTIGSEVLGQTLIARARAVDLELVGKALAGEMLRLPGAYRGHRFNYVRAPQGMRLDLLSRGELEQTWA